MLENIRLSFQGIFSHKLRSFLTMLGIIIGIAAIIAIVSTIKGTSEQIKENLVGSGNNIVEIKLSQGEWGYVSGDSQPPKNVPVVDDAIKAEIEAVDEVVAVASYRLGTMYEGIYFGNTGMEGATVIDTDPDYIDLVGYNVTRGRMFVPDDFKNYNRFAILDDGAASALAGGDDPVGKTLEIKGVPYVIIGVVEQQDSFAPKIETLEDWETYYGNGAGGKVFVPDTVWPMIYGFDEPYNVVVKPTNTEAMTKAGKKTADILNDKIKSGSSSSSMGEEQKEDSESRFKYKSQDLLEKAKQMQEVSNSTSRQLIWIASISLLVGGIGVMNIMLVSVTERTREIGLKKALGARKSVILWQFLTEAAVLTFLGGVIGVGCGIGLAYLIANVAETPVAISGAAIVVSVAFSTIIGIVFGFIPSIKAANLNPIDALRYE